MPVVLVKETPWTDKLSESAHRFYTFVYEGLVAVPTIEPDELKSRLRDVIALYSVEGHPDAREIMRHMPPVENESV